MSQRAPTIEIPEGPHRSVVAALVKLGLALRHQAWRSGERLTPTQAQALAVLRARPGLRLAALARELGVSAPTASDAVAALGRKGLVERRRDDADARAAALVLSDEGARVADRVAEWPDLLLRAVDALPGDEQAAMLRGLSRMIRALQEDGLIPVARMCVTCRFFRPHAHDDPERPHHCAFVDAPFGDRQLRLDCADFEPPDREEAA